MQGVTSSRPSFGGVFPVRRCCKVNWLKADDMAEDAGNPAMAGVVLLGALSNLAGGGQEIWLQVIKRLVPARFVEMNQKAFLAGSGTDLE